ncbi:MAG: hypothetical protein K9K65_11915 [Desulfarculaceae bacterium]|nr:hypothetical protein [Desulfarculaceae bacterium]MCF8098539.1 hypothetical protein [Desulfarculaceae bacterium]MCF8123947.1 hypothetical protein [Desulfarculaceae bacterium]
MVASLKKQWNNGGRPTLVTIGVGSLLTIMVTVAVFLHTTATARFSEQLTRVQKSIDKLDKQTSQQIKDSEGRTTTQLNRTEARLSEQICQVKEDTTRRVERLEDQLNQAKGPDIFQIMRQSSLLASF